MIDLRSDTITKPDKDMLDAIMNAKLGDDVFGEDPATNELQDYIANLFKKDAALFVSSGTMGNQLGIKVLTSPGDEILVEAQSHIFFYETAAPSLISRVQLRTIPSERGMMPIAEIEKAIRPDVYYFPKTSLITLENTHNRHSGTILSLDYIREVYDFAKAHNLKMHLDGARLWNAIAATKIQPDAWAKYFDTITVCFSKGLGAPAGSILIGSRENIEKARKWRKILGGGMRQTGVLAAAAYYAIKNNISKIAYDNANARIFAEIIDSSYKINLDILRVETNIVYFDFISPQQGNEFIEKCREKGLMMIATGENTVRAVFHLHISAAQAKEAAEIVLDCLD